MEKRSCAPGSQWDSLIKHCVSHKALGLMPSEAPPALVKPVSSPSGPDESWSAVGPGVWICVGLVASGSVLVLLLWLLVYRRHRTSQNTGEKDSEPQTPSSVEQEEETLSPWSHLNGQTRPIGEGACGRGLCNGGAGHGLPLPATELGDSALVTAKTGHPVEV